MNKRTLALATGILFIAVAMGAFGAHGLKSRVPVEALSNWKTAVEYQFYHGLALLWLAAMHDRLPGRTVSLVRLLFAGGILLFSGSLYLLATRDILGIEDLTSMIGPVTPLGGLLFLAGWVVLLVAALRKG